jgi:hypothetical protein
MCFSNVRVAFRNGGVLPVAATLMMRHRRWRNLGETLASLYRALSSG